MDLLFVDDSRGWRASVSQPALPGSFEISTLIPGLESSLLSHRGSEVMWLWHGDRCTGAEEIILKLGVPSFIVPLLTGVCTFFR